MEDRRPTDAKEAFAPHAEAYRVSESFRRGEDLLELVRLIEPKPTDRLLDVATAAGHTALTLAPHVASVVGLDITPSMQDAFEREARERGVEGAVFVLGRAEELPFLDGSFDLVTVRRAMHHMEDPAVVLHEAARVLRPGGRIGISDFTAEDADIDFVNETERLRDRSHRRALSPAGWERLAAECGLGATAREVRAETVPFETWRSPFPMPEPVMEAFFALCRQHPRSAERHYPDGATRVLKLRLVQILKKP